MASHRPKEVRSCARGSSIHQSELKQLEARGNLVALAHGRSRPVPAGPPSRLRIVRMPRPTHEVREPVTRACRVRTVFSASFPSAVRLTQVGPPGAHRARHTNPYPSGGPREAAAGSDRLELNRLSGFRS